jgi:DNA end-binding protein Ku
MAARAIWKGVLQVGDASVPVKLYSAVSSTEAVHFRLLHEKDLTPVQGRMVNPKTGRQVASDDTKRGYVTDEGDLVVLEKEELAELEPPASRDVELLRFVPVDSVDPRWYDHPYYLGPDGEPGAYAALAAALEKRGVAGIARWVMRKQHYVGALLVEDGYPMLVTLRHAGELVDASALPRPGGRSMSGKELQMATQLLRALEGEFDPTEWKDEHKDRLLELIEAKAEGKTIPIAEHRPRKTDVDLSEALRASLAAARKSA